MIGIFLYQSQQYDQKNVKLSESQKAYVSGKASLSME